VLVALDRDANRPLRAQLEEGLREAVRGGRLAAGTRLPSSRALAADLGVSRRLIVDVYAQLLAEGYFLARRGAGTFVADSAGSVRAAEAEAAAPVLAFDFFPGYPDLAHFPRAPWMRALREALRDLPDQALGYPDVRGAPELRRALAGHLRRVRGASADPDRIVVCSGAGQAIALLARALHTAGGSCARPVRVAVEDPGFPLHRAILTAHGALVEPVRVDERGVCTDELPDQGFDAVLVTPAHQSPTGVALAPARRSALLEWASAGDRVVIEDDYDAEYRYDRAPLAALQGLAPERVVYLGTASKTLAPALRLGWMVLPRHLIDSLLAQKMVSDHGCPTIEQLALGRLIESGAYDRHLRQARRRHRSRRDAMVRAVARHLPGARVTGVAAGLHAIVRLPEPVDGARLMKAARARSVGAYPLGYAYFRVRKVDENLVLGYANLSEAAIDEGIRRLAQAVAEVS
jgi:GntR family transcriptional regulator/MocR family aminotransferase